MADSSFVPCLVRRCVVGALVLLIWSAAVASAQDKTSSQADPPDKPAPPIVVAPETLAQAVQDDVNAAARKYHLTELQMTGVVTKQSGDKDKVHSLQFDVTITDRQTEKPVDFSIFFGLKDPLPKGDKRIEEFAAGKTVTVRGKSIAMGNGQVTLLYCVLVPNDAKKDDP